MMKKYILDGEEYLILGYSAMGDMSLYNRKTHKVHWETPPEEQIKIPYCDPATGRIKIFNRKTREVE